MCMLRKQIKYDTTLQNTLPGYAVFIRYDLVPVTTVFSPSMIVVDFADDIVFAANILCNLKGLVLDYSTGVEGWQVYRRR